MEQEVTISMSRASCLFLCKHCLLYEYDEACRPSIIIWHVVQSLPSSLLHLFFWGAGMGGKIWKTKWKKQLVIFCRDWPFNLKSVEDVGVSPDKKIYKLLQQHCNLLFICQTWNSMLLLLAGPNYLRCTWSWANYHHYQSLPTLSCWIEPTWVLLWMVLTYTPWWFLLDTIFYFCYPMGTIKTMVFHLSTSWVLFGPWSSVFPESS